MGEKSVLIVGATGGLGREVLRTMAQTDFDVHFTGRKAEDVARLQEEFPGGAGHVVDAVEAGAIRGVIEEIDADRPLAAYVHIAGGYAGGKRIDELEEEDWEPMHSANWTTLRHGASAAFRIMRARKSGSIITIGALAALDGSIGAAPYAVAKAAVVAFTRCLAEEGKGYGVRANCIIPGIIDTDANRKAMPDADRDGWVAPDQIGCTISFLCGTQSVGVNGSLIMMRGRL